MTQATFATQSCWLHLSSWVEKNVQLFCLLVVLICATPLLFITPPFQVPDEQQHFFRAYQISEGSLYAVVRDGAAGATLPSSLIETTNKFLGSRSLHGERTVSKFSVFSLKENLGKDLRPDDREFIAFTGAAFYSPIPYIPQALAMFVGRKLGFGPLDLMYFARIANLLVALMLISVATRLTPYNKSAFMLVSLLPMSLTLFSSISADSLVIGTAFLFLALSFQAFEKKYWSTKSYVAALICAIVFCSIKIVYAPLILISAPAFFQSKNIKKNLLCQIILFLVPVLVTYLWLRSVSDLIVPPKVDTNIAEQLQFVKHQPWMFVKAMIHGIISSSFYFFMIIGILGWLSVKLYSISYFIPVLALSAALFSRSTINVRRDSLILGWWLILSASCITLIFLALYLYWNPVGAYAVDGVQGRYFTPLLPLMVATCAIALSRQRLSLTSTNAVILVSALGLLEASLTFARLIQVYWA